MVDWKRHTMRRARLALPAAILAGLALAGCSGTHVGDAWQCPIAQGAVCASVAGADPAAPRTEPQERLALKRPLHEPVHEPRGAAGTPVIPQNPPATARDTRPCDTECGPFDWLARLFAPTDREPDGSAAREGRAGDAVSPVPETALPLPAPEGPAPGDPAPMAAEADDLRVPETLGRIWIGPFVDAGGLYREGSWVRMVIAPARWRLP